MTTRKKARFKVGDTALAKGAVVERHPEGGFYVKIGSATLYCVAHIAEEVLSLADPSALAAHDAALAQKLLNSFTEQTAKLEADNARLREAVLHLAQSNHGYSPDACSACGTARKLAEPPEIQGKETT